MSLHPSEIISLLIRINFFFGLILLTKWTAYDFTCWNKFEHQYKRLFPFRMAIIIWLFCLSIIVNYLQS
jgi:hypothetical protein